MAKSSAELRALEDNMRIMRSAALLFGKGTQTLIYIALHREVNISFTEISAEIMVG
ncbi:hypothetical protein D3C77_776310 [compost metagenome]